MTPKEKAEELIQKYYSWGINKQGQTLSELESKQCALIAVNEILLNEENKHTVLSKIYDYWEEVKQEIKNI
jgi:hypothetical protein